MNAALEKYHRCQPISDDELRELIVHHRHAVSGLEELSDPKYTLVLRELRCDLQRFESFRAERKKSGA